MSTLAPARVVTVLVVDDTPTVRLLLRHCLSASGRFEVIGEAVDGSDAIAQATERQPDIVLLDLAMPVMDGLEAIPHLTTCSPRSRIIVLSGFNADAAADRALQLGAHAYIEKRHRPDEMLRRIAAAWETAGSPGVPASEPARGLAPPQTVSVEPAAPAVNNQFRLAFQHAPIGTALISVDGRVAEANPAFCRITGHETGDLVGRQLDDITHPDDRAVDTWLLGQLVSGEIDSYQAEKRIIRADGQVVWVLLSRSLFAPTGVQARMSVTQIVDITQQKSLAEALESANGELARSNGDLSDFAAVAAHDLKSPLHVILGFSELLESQYGEQFDDRGRELLASVVAGGRLMEELIDGLLAYCRVGSADLQVSDADLDEIVAAVRTGLTPQIEAADAIVTSDPLPRVHGDPVQLQELFQNLMANALRFTRPGVTPRVHISAQRLDDAWIVSVADNGIGIDRNQRQRVFNMFTRLHTDDRFGGTGIGLTICQRIAERHRGAIWVEDTPGGGSRFLVRLPGPQEDPSADEDRTAAPDAHSRGGPLKVLLVEDSPEHAKLVAALLMAAHNPIYHLTSVATLSDAVIAMRTTELDCVLLDLSLPDADNLEALAQVRAEGPQIPVVVITSSSDETLAFAAVKEGAQDYLVKGRIDAEQLSRSIRWAVQRKALESDLARAAWRDPLTKLANRTLLLDRLRGALARAERSGESVALLYLDLDDFKAVNDRFGHDVGDRVLVAVAERLNHNIRPQDTAARLGGDEFVVLCEGLGDAGSDVDVVRSRLEGAIEMPIIDGDGNTFQVRASVGAATSLPSDAPDTLMRRADEAMYQTKDNRRR